MLRSAQRDLKRSDVDPSEAEASEMFAVSDASELYPEFKPVPALAIPYPDPWADDFVTFKRDGDENVFCRVRYLHESANNGFTKKKTTRYAQPVGSGVHPYFPLVEGVDWVEVAEDPDTPVCITEGEKKALRATLAGIPTIGLGGVYNFLENGDLLPMLDRIEWRKRPVYICYDSDADSNPDIQAAEGRLATALSMDRKASVFLVRLPHGEDGAKVGLDDYLAAEGDDAFFKLLEQSPQMRKIDQEVLRLNEHVAWIESDGLIYDMQTHNFLSPTHFVRGSKYSTRHIQVPAKRGQGVKSISVATQWLTHPHARRYDDIIFRPGDEEQTLRVNGGMALNIWDGFQPQRGDVTPFLDLTEHLFQNLEGDPWLPLKLMAYKAQNPSLKIPLALILLGGQGGGKTMWSSIVREAFSPYGTEVSPGQIGSDFNGYVERTLLATINEIKGEQMKYNIGAIRGMISDPIAAMNEKYRKSRNVETFTQYIFTSNDRSVGAFGSDDRRMIVIDCAGKREDEFYDYVGDWKANGGPKRLLHYLLNYPLEGWRPPKTAPLTAEKYMAYMENLTPVQRLAEEMKTADDNVLVMWIEQAMAWAQTAEVSGNTQNLRLAQEITSSLNQMQIRPWYTSEELAMLFPAITMQLHGNKTSGTPSGQISKELREAGIRYLRNADDPRGFRYRGMYRQFLIVAEHDEWDQPITQAEFERSLREFPTYKEWRNMKRKKNR